jgi:Mn2+/Fe2+ NRAMP family transporter
MKRFWSVLFWSVIAAAFIGPGTVTTAASAGAGFGYALLWALAFSTFACLLLQEASARLTVASGRDLGQAIRQQYPAGWRGGAVVLLVLGAVVLGCAAYEAGNILGGAAGALLGFDLGPRAATAVTAIAASALLWFGRTRLVARLLGALVAVMGIAFLVTAARLAPSPLELLRGTLVPGLPSESSLLVLGLVGTTVVPYNLFLGSGLARGERLSELRFGLGVSIVLGGLISMGIVVVGAAVTGPFSFEALVEVLTLRLGPWSRTLFGTGLYAAGLSSAITAPLAAAITARSLFARKKDEGWSHHSWRFRAVWIGVLAVGVGFGLAGIRPVPAILAAQAFNGALLPFVAVFLLLAVNDVRLMGPLHVNGPRANLAMAAVVAVTIPLGVAGVLKALAAATGLPAPGGAGVLACAVAVAAPTGLLVVRRLREIRAPRVAGDPGVH